MAQGTWHDLVIVGTDSKGLQRHDMKTKQTRLINTSLGTPEINWDVRAEISLVREDKAASQYGAIGQKRRTLLSSRFVGLQRDGVVAVGLVVIVSRRGARRIEDTCDERHSIQSTHGMLV